VSQEVVFDQGPANANWRQYQKVSAVEKRPDQNGETRETKVEGGLQGKKLTLKTTDGKLELLEGDGDKAKPVPAMLANGVPGRVALDGFLPQSAVAVGEEFDLGKTFLPALRGIVHPVTADRSADAAGQGGQGGRGQGGQGGRGQGGRGGFGGMGGGAAGTVIQLIGGGKLNVAATGKLLAVDEKNGQKIATIEVKSKLTGKGAAEELGLPPQGFGGRGGRGQGGQGGGANAGTNTVDATFELTGKVHLNMTQQRIVDVELGGDIVIAREGAGTRQGQDGADMKFETKSNTKGKFQLQASSGPVPAAAPATGK
jgi:hypothetical protein